METSMTDRLLGCFAKAVREKKELTEAELSSAYTEFMNHLQSITDGGQPVIVKLRRLRRLELELETYRHRAFPVLEDGDGPATFHGGASRAPCRAVICR